MITVSFGNLRVEKSPKSELLDANKLLVITCQNTIKLLRYTVPKKSVWTASIGSCLVSLCQCCHLKCHVYDSYMFLRHLLRMSVN